MPETEESPDMADEELVPVMVPKSVLAQVTAVLHRYFAGENIGAPGSEQPHGIEPEAVEVPRNGYWSRDDIQRLYRSFRNQRGRKVIDLIADRSLNNDLAYYGELMEHAGLTEYELRSQFSWFSKKGKALKGTQKGCWPMTVTDAGSDAEKGTRYAYRMDPRIARWWLEVSGGSQTSSTAETGDLS